MTPWQKHVKQWRRCTRCLLANQRSRVCLARGKVPCDVLFVGEAPGLSEDTLGSPFVGPAGNLLQKIIDRNLRGRSYCLTNLVGCFPREAKELGVNEPPKEAIEACSDRLEQMIELCNPRLVIAVGKLSDKWLKKSHGFPERLPYEMVIHPAAILRMDPVQRGLAAQRLAVVIQDAVEEVFDV